MSIKGQFVSNSINEESLDVTSEEFTQWIIAQIHERNIDVTDKSDLLKIKLISSGKLGLDSAVRFAQQLFNTYQLGMESVPIPLVNPELV